jgi:DNA repair protein RadC
VAACDDLIKHFGNVKAALSARSEARRQALSAWPAAATQLDLIVRTARHLVTAELCSSHPLTNPERVAAFLAARIAHDVRESVITLYLDNAGYLIRDEVVSLGSIRQAPVHPREIVRRALELGAAILIIGHNHPSGDLAASDADIEATHALAAAARLFDIELFDHLIVSRFGWISLRARGIF